MLYDDIEGNESARIPFLGVLLSPLALFAFVPLGVVLGLCRVEAGVRAMESGVSLKLALWFVIYASAIHTLITFPLFRLVYPSQRFSRVARALVAICFVTPPFSSFAYYLGAGMPPSMIHELFLTLVPACLLGSVLAESSRRPWVFSLVMALATFIPFFLMNDILSPFHVLINYVSEGPGLYFWRVFVPIFVTSTLIVLKVMETGEEHGILRGLGTTLFVLSGYSLFVQYVLPLALGAREPGQIGTADLSFVGCAVGAWWLYHRHRFGYWFLVALAALECGIVSVRVALSAYQVRMGEWELARLSHSLVLLAVFGFLLGVLASKRIRALFLVEQAEPAPSL